ncbi:MAG: ABC transporter permease [Gaiellaceae bacterium]
MTLLRQAWYFMNRHLLNLWRQPIWIFVTLVQPVIWLLLYGALFKNVVKIPGFHSGSYIEFLAPGVVVMTAFFNAGWSGMAVIDDIDKGITDRFLVSPVIRPALILGRLLQGTVIVIVQSLVIVFLALIVGASFHSVSGLIVLFAVASLLAAATMCLSTALALVARREETMIAVMNFFMLPLTFLSTTFMQKSLIPSWMSRAADFNPVNWAVEAGRGAMLPNPNWGLVGTRFALLAGLLAICLGVATRAFRSYQRAV